MGALKNIVARGAYLIETGADEMDVWSELMIHHAGPNVTPFLYDIRQWALIIVQKKAGAQSAKMNCWDFKRCNSNTGNDRIKKSDVCPVFSKTALDGINGGKNGGRSCWLIPGTLCGSRIQRAIIPKSIACRLCDFKRHVLREENPHRIITDTFLTMLIQE